MELGSHTLQCKTYPKDREISLQDSNSVLQKELLCLLFPLHSSPIFPCPLSDTTKVGLENLLGYVLFPSL